MASEIIGERGGEAGAEEPPQGGAEAPAANADADVLVGAIGDVEMDPKSRVLPAYIRRSGSSNLSLTATLPVL